MRKRTTALGGLLAILLLILVGCGAIPTDPQGSLRTIEGGTMRVGVTESVTDDAVWVRLGDGQEPSGIEPDLVREFARMHDAHIEWVRGSEQSLVEQLKHGELHLIIGGLGSSTPWTSHAGLTKPYVETKDQYGKTIKHVMLVPKGENALLLELDKFLQSQEVTV